MRPPRHLADCKVDSGEVDQVPMSAAMRRHISEMNLAACQQIRAVMEGRNASPDVELIVPECGGPPSAILDPTTIEFDPKLWDRQSQARGASGKYLKSLRKQPQV
jgi:hypothetical protein